MKDVFKSAENRILAKRVKDKFTPKAEEVRKVRVLSSGVASVAGQVYNAETGGYRPGDVVEAVNVGTKGNAKYVARYGARDTVSYRDELLIKRIVTKSIEDNETSLVNAPQVTTTPAELTSGEIFNWVATGSGSASSGFSFTIPSYAVAGQYAIIYMAMKNGEMSGNPIDSDIVRITGITASYAGLSQNSPSIGISRQIGGVTPPTYQSIYMQFAIIYIQQSNIGNTYTGSNTGSQNYENGSEYAYGLVCVNENYFSPNYYGENYGVGSDGTYQGSPGYYTDPPGYPVMTIDNYNYPNSYTPNMRITAYAGYGSSVKTGNLANESFLALDYTLLGAGDVAGQSQTVSQTVAMMASHTFSPVRL